MRNDAPAMRTNGAESTGGTVAPTSASGALFKQVWDGRAGVRPAGPESHVSSAAMHDDAPPRQLNERTGKHFCVRCLAEVEAEELFRNDYLCEACAQSDEYPLKSTPEPREGGGKGRNAGRRK